MELPASRYLALIDPTALQPSRILGWYDTEFAEYDLPPAECLVDMSEIEWNERFDKPFYEAGSFVAAPPEEAPPPVVGPMTPLDFIGRLTTAEQVAIVTAAATNPIIMLWLLQLVGAQQVNVSDARTIAGVDAMIAASLLAPERRAEMLAP